MAFDWNRYLQLPMATLQDKRIEKTEFSARAGLSKKEQKLLHDLRRLTLYAAVSKDNTGILPYTDEQYDIRGIMYFDCTLTKWDNAPALITLLHRVFPNPTVLLMRTVDPFGGYRLSIGLKRKSLAEKGTAVVESMESTGILDDMDASTALLWNALAYGKLPQRDLLDYVHGIQDVVLAFNMVPRLGFMLRIDVLHRTTIRQELANLKRLDEKIRRLKAKRRDKTTTLGESAELRVIESGTTEETQNIVEHIKELCHD